MVGWMFGCMVVWMDGQMDEHDGNQPSRNTLSGQDGEQSKEMEESRIKI